MPKVVFFTFLPPDLEQLLTQYAPPEFEVSAHSIDLTDAEKIPLVRDADFLVLFPGRISAEVLEAAPRLKFIQLVSAGYDSLDLDLCRKRGIRVANNGGSNALDVAEHTLALILGFYRRLVELDGRVRHGRWQGSETGNSTYTICGKTVGIVGMGHIGRQVARLLAAFGARLLCHDKYLSETEADFALDISHTTLEDLLREADIVTLHVPLTEETRHLIGPRQLSLMKPTALLVNTCRGPVVDEQALIQALSNQLIAGAALDVLEQEPPDPDNPLLKFDHVLLTPHSAGVTRDTWSRRGPFVFANLQKVWEGKPPSALIGSEN